MIYYVQRGSIRRPYVTGPIGEAVALDYMGPDFKDDALDKSLRSLRHIAYQMRTVEFPDICRDDGAILTGFGIFPEGVHRQYAGELKAISENSHRCAEWTNLAQALQSPRFPAHMQTERDRELYLSALTTFWWDIEHHAMLSFDREFMKRLPDVLVRTWAASPSH